MSDFLLRPCVIGVVIERPLKFDLGSEFVRHLVDSVGLVNEACDLDTIKASLGKFPGGSKEQQQQKHHQVRQHRRTGTADSVSSSVPHDPLEEAIATARGFAANFSSIKLVTKQILLHFPVGCSKSSTGGSASGSGQSNARGNVELVGGMKGLSCACNFQSKGHGKKATGGGLLDSLTLKTEVDKLLVRLRIGAVVHNLLNPWSPAIKLTVSWLAYSPMPVLHLSLNSELLHLKFGPNHLIALKSLQSYLGGSQKERHDASKVSDKCYLTENAPPRHSQSPTPSSVLSVGSSTASAVGEQHYVDDLRAGAFQVA
jgi:hypothetical protein